jgi:hypothetical protein
MGRYIQYKRINKIVDADLLEKEFKDLIKNGWEIIHYNEESLSKKGGLNLKFIVTMICGKLNEGNKKIL